MSPTDPPRLRDDEALAAAFTDGPYLLFKHSLLCPVSAAAFREYRHFLAEAGTEVGARTGWLSVTDERPLSSAVAERTGVRHESPQAFVLEGGAVRWHASHGAITRASLRAAWEAANAR